MPEDLHLKKLRLLKEQPWKEIYEELVAHAEWRALKKYWRRGTKGHLALGVSAEDLVQEIIRKAFDGTRNWQPEKRELVPWLKQQIDSDMYHLSRRQQEVFMPEANDGQDLTDVIVYQTANLEQITPTQMADPEDILLTKEKIEYNEGILFEAIAGDPELDKMNDAVIARGEFKPSDIAQDLGVSVKQVYNWKRKLRRRVIKLMMKREGA